MPSGVKWALAWAEWVEVLQVEAAVQGAAQEASLYLSNGSVCCKGRGWLLEIEDVGCTRVTWWGLLRLAIPGAAVWGSPQVAAVWGGPQMAAVWGSQQAAAVWGSQQAAAVWGSPQVSGCTSTMHSLTPGSCLHERTGNPYTCGSALHAARQGGHAPTMTDCLTVAQHYMLPGRAGMPPP